MSARIAPLCFGLLLAIAAAASDRAVADLVEQGEQLYRTGRLASGAAPLATAQGDVSLAGGQASCAGCHGRSGLGYGEGGIFPLAVTGPALFRPRAIERPELYAARSSGPGTRPAYTEESLRRAIRDGVDPAGRTLDPLMPRYALGDEDLDALVAYLRSLGAATPTGVTNTDIHFATVVGEGADPSQRAAMLEVLEAFFQDKNAGTRYESERARSRNFVLEWDYRAYRQWRLHVWELRGAPESWGGQLEDYYRAQPVFALVSGIAPGPWRPIHDFCERREVPCLFPHTTLPVAADDFYTLYFSEGLSLEARVLARHLSGARSGSGPIVAVHRGDEAGRVAATALRAALEGSGQELLERRLPEDPGASARFWRELLAGDAPAVLAVWLAAADLDALASLSEPPAGLGSIYLSSSLVPECARALPERLRAQTFCIHPFALPEAQAGGRRRVEVWLGSHGLVPRDERVQIATYFAVRALGEGLMHVSGNFSREYLVERIEHRLGAMVSASIYPSVGLGAGQRFASKGAYIVRDGAEGGLIPVTEWIVP